ncbi:MAG: DUF4255 domain-containing protein [Methylococcales bacterium]|nr:DUF4255 domain-containing protein [Methylococcales bacterium]
MSSPLAIAAVTAAFKDLLNDGLLNHDLSSAVGNINVTSSPPDRITTGAQEPNQLNLFLYQVSANPGWRNVNLPGRGSQQGERLSNPPLALDLHYLLSAYGSSDTHAEILLGFAMYLLHETPVITRERLHVLFGPSTPLVDGTILPGLFKNLSAENIADQVEMIKITPNYLNSDELSKLWTAMQARYRPSMAYTVSVVLIQSTASVKSSQPVLKRGQNDQGPVAIGAPAPALSGVRPAASAALPAMRLGDQLLISGNNLVGTDITVILENTDTTGNLQNRLPPLETAIPGSLGALLPDLATAPDAIHLWRAGIWMVSLEVAHPQQSVWRTNAVPIALAPVITLDPAAVKPNHVAAGAQVNLSCTPRLSPQQGKNVRVIFGSKEIVPAKVDTPLDDATHPNNHQLPTTISFLVPATDSTGVNLKPGEYLIRLRVDGIDSIPVTLSGSPPRLDFDPLQKVNVI